jgi:hypothetical protein
MNTYFNLNRIGYLLQADWIEHRKSFLLSMGGSLLVWITLLYFNGGGTEAQRLSFFLGELITFIYYCRFISKKIHQPKGLYYTLPASNQEKYFVLLFEGILFFLAFAAIYGLGLFLFKLFSPSFVMVSLFSLYAGTEPIGLLLVLLLSAIIILSHITFRKLATLIALMGTALYLLLLISTLVKVVSMVSSDGGFNLANLTPEFALEASLFMKQLFVPVTLAATIVVLYIGYLKLKEKELR